MNRDNSCWPRWAINIALIICLALAFDAFLLRHFNISFHYDIQIANVIEIIVTIILALYLAHVVEVLKEKKRAKTDILASILSGLLADVDSLSNQIFDSQLPYSRLSTFTKMVLAKVQSITEIITSLGIENTNISASISSIKNKLQYIRPILTGTKDKSKDAEDYMVVSEGIVKEIADQRISKIQSNLSSLRKQLFSLWLLIISLD